MTFVGNIRCVAYRCQDEVARGKRLCLAHQRRLDQGGGLPTAGELSLGDPSGHGLFGVVDRSDTGVLCHECGKRFVNLGVHLQRTHQIDGIVYRRRHGIRAKESLAMTAAPDGLPRRRPHPCKRCNTEITTEGKLCTTCSQQRKDELKRRRSPKVKPERVRWRKLTENEKVELLAARQDELPALIQKLQQDRIPSKVIGQVLGNHPTWMSRHYPRPGWGRKGQE